MKRKMKSWIAIILCITISNIFPSFTAKAGTMLYNNATGNQDGYSYELWKDYGNTSMELNNGGNFGCSWSNIGNALFRKGKKFNSGQNWSSLNGIKVDYGCQYNPSGNSYLCVYGWTRNPLVEYYIVDSWGSWRPPGASSKGTITVDGGTYDVYETTRVNQPSIDGNTTFQQYWSVRTSKRTSGTINVAEHFRQWEQKGMRMGSLVEVALTVEGYQSSGNANVYKNDITIGGGSNTDPTPVSAPSTRNAYTSIEAEQFNSKNSSTLQEIGTDDGRGIGYIENGNTTTYSKIQFGNNGANKFTAKVATGQDVTIQIRSGSASGALLGTLSVPATGGYDTYKTLSTSISNFTGTSDIVLVFSGAVNVDNFVFGESSGGGNIQPTTQPSGSRSAFDNIQAEDYDSNNGSNMQTFTLDNGGSAIGYIENGYSITFNDVDFGNGTDSVMFRAAAQDSTSVQIRSGSANGTLLGTMSVPSTGSWDTYQDMTGTINNVTGVQDITLVFSGAVNLDYFKFISNGITPTADPTTTPDPTPTATSDPNAKSAFSNIEAEDYDSRSASNIETFTLEQGGSAIGYIESGNSTTYNDIDFGDGALSVTANAATSQDATIEVHAGSANGTLLGTISVGSTGSFDTYKTVSANISKTAGVKDIVLVYSGAVNLDYIKFSTKKVSNSDQTGTATLLNTYGSYLGNMGTCINYSQLQNSGTLNALKQQYNSITLENEMKPDAILGGNPSLISVSEARSQGYYIPSNYQDSMVPRLNFSTIDNVMRICAQNGLKMRAHTLVWHSQTPGWFFRSGFNGGAGFVSTSVMDARQEFYVKSMINHVYNSQYGNVVYAWDVCNEHLHAVNSGWAGVYGNAKNASFIKNAFKYANDALVALNNRNSVSLFYNDYNEYEVVDDMISLVNFVNSNGKLCDGVGLQSHVDTGYPSASMYKNAIQKFAKAGFEIQITEFDATNNNASTQANYCYDLFKSILECKKDGANITGLTVWGMYDGMSWRASQSPLLFSQIGQPKQAYNSVLKAYTDMGLSIGQNDDDSTPGDDAPTPTVTPDPTPTATSDPNAKSAFSNIEAEDYDSRSATNIETFTLSQGGSTIGYIESGNSTTYKNIDFGDGAVRVTANAATQQDATIEVHAGSANGTLLGTIYVGSTGSFDTYQTVSANISKTTGVKDIVLVYSGAVNVDYIKFSAEAASGDSAPVYREKTFQYCPNEYKQGNQRGGNVVSLGYYAGNAYGGQDYKTMNVYLPYGYNANDKSTKYNVFYLMHGGGENENTIFGGAGRGSEMKNILDNMIANGKCAPMIVVTPTTNKGSDDFQKFYSELVDSVIPKIAQTYNTYAGSGSKEEIKASREHRAFGGFSMGSVCTWSVFSNDLAYVKYFMPLSGDCWQFGQTAGASQSQRTAEYLASCAKNAGYGPNDFRLFCATGGGDIAYPNMNPMIQAMKNCSDTFQTNKNFFYIVCNEGTHQWSYINQYVYNYLPDLFQ